MGHEGVKPAAAGGASVPEPTPVKKQFDQKAFKTEVARPSAVPLCECQGKRERL